MKNTLQQTKTNNLAINKSYKRSNNGKKHHSSQTENCFQKCKKKVTKHKNKFFKLPLYAAYQTK